MNHLDFLIEELKKTVNEKWEKKFECGFSYYRENHDPVYYNLKSKVKYLKFLIRTLKEMICKNCYNYRSKECTKDNNYRHPDYYCNWWLKDK